ncbi:MAG: hypothetical protein KJP14_00910, partial [Eudoraea sp.]|nr:hypothetical protein [Eudoraea sp.]
HSQEWAFYVWSIVESLLSKNARNRESIAVRQWALKYFQLRNQRNTDPKVVQSSHYGRYLLEILIPTFI